MEDNWVVLMEVYNQEEAQLVGGLLLMAEIPAILEHEDIGELFKFTVGPLAKIKIKVPESRLEDANKVLAGEIGDPEETQG